MTNKDATLREIGDRIKTQRPHLDPSRIDKAVNLVSWSRVRMGDPWTWFIVQSFDGPEYDVFLTEPGESKCTCADYRYRTLVCKHVIAAYIYQAYLKRSEAASQRRAQAAKAKRERDQALPVEREKSMLEALGF